MRPNTWCPSCRSDWWIDTDLCPECGVELTVVDERGNKGEDEARLPRSTRIAAAALALLLPASCTVAAMLHERMGCHAPAADRIVLPSEFVIERVSADGGSCGETTRVIQLRHQHLDRTQAAEGLVASLRAAGWRTEGPMSDFVLVGPDEVEARVCFPFASDSCDAYADSILSAPVVSELVIYLGYTDLGIGRWSD